MVTVTVDLPAELVSAAKLDPGNVSQEAAKLIALELFREETVSLGRAAKLCATPLASFMEFAAAHGVPPIRFSAQQFEEDRLTLAKIRPRRLFPIRLRSLLWGRSPWPIAGALRRRFTLKSLLTVQA
jgi:predicted HTH domain antitoxin